MFDRFYYPQGRNDEKDNQEAQQNNLQSFNEEEIGENYENEVENGGEIEEIITNKYSNESIRYSSRLRGSPVY